MEGRTPIDVADWKDVPNSTALPALRHRGFLTPAVIGVCGALLIHVALIQVIQFGAGSSVRQRVVQRPIDGRSNVNSEASLLIQSVEPSARHTNDTIDNIVSTMPIISKIQAVALVLPDSIPALEIDSLALDDDPPAIELGTANGGDLQKFAAIYSTQIHARIERTWRRPRSPVETKTRGQKSTDDSFQCEAQIVQDAWGNVQEILLPKCNGSVAWQQSLVTAIREASPLPAPPDQRVFSRSITEMFIGVPYTRGESEDEYEIEPRTLAKPD